MELPSEAEPILLSFYCGGEDSDGLGNCPAVHRTNRGTWMWQGELRDDPHTRAQLYMPSPTEVGVEVGDAVVDAFARAYVKEKYGVDLG